jgi:hypothetical protein
MNCSQRDRPAVSDPAADRRTTLKALATVFAVPFFGNLSVSVSALAAGHQEFFGLETIRTSMLYVSVVCVMAGFPIAILSLIDHTRRPWVVAGALAACVLSFTPFVTGPVVWRLAGNP